MLRAHETTLREPKNPNPKPKSPSRCANVKLRQQGNHLIQLSVLLVIYTFILWYKSEFLNSKPVKPYMPM